MKILDKSTVWSVAYGGQYYERFGPTEWWVRRGPYLEPHLEPVPTAANRDELEALFQRAQQREGTKQ